MKAIMRWIQEIAFNDELACLKQNKPINKKSRLLCLNIFLDWNDNLIRAGGRLQNSSLTYDVKHPIVLPNDHHLIKMLVKHVHIEQLHAGVQGTLAELVLIHNGHKLDIRHKKFVIHAVDILLIFT
jgi:hypothetical protein